MTFVPGESGNPNGRPKKGQTLTDLMVAFLQEVPKGSEISYKEAFIRKVYKMAMESNDVAAMKLLWNYVDGMPVQKLKHSGDEDGEPIGVVVYTPKKNKNV